MNNNTVMDMIKAFVNGNIKNISFNNLANMV